MGPVLLADKSTVQALSAEELRFLEKHFTVMLTPTLVLEVLADLKKDPRASQDPRNEVRVLAAKLAGLGKVCVEHWALCARSLLGNRMPRHRQIPVRGHRAYAANGSAVDSVSVSPAEEAVSRWAAGEFNEADDAMASWWRDIEARIDLDQYGNQLDPYHVVLPTVDSIGSAATAADRLLAERSLQEVWICWLIDTMPVPEGFTARVFRRWRDAPVASLKMSAPYAYTYARTTLTFLLGLRGGAIGARQTNLFDLQYCYYIPFAMVFSSRDRLHERLAVEFLDDDQDFMRGDALKLDLRRLADEWQALSEQERLMRRYALSSYPPPAVGSVIAEAWRRHMLPWTPNSVNRAVQLSQGLADEAVRAASEMFDHSESGHGH
jgi:hypothetical protein